MCHLRRHELGLDLRCRWHRTHIGGARKALLELLISLGPLSCLRQASPNNTYAFRLGHPGQHKVE